MPSAPPALSVVGEAAREACTTRLGLSSLGPSATRYSQVLPSRDSPLPTRDSRCTGRGGTVSRVVNPWSGRCCAYKLHAHAHGRTACLHRPPSSAGSAAWLGASHRAFSPRVYAAHPAARRRMHANTWTGFAERRGTGRVTSLRCERRVLERVRGEIAATSPPQPSMCIRSERFSFFLAGCE